ncbi:MAG TPA: hypothetical protein VLS49_09020 [Usitatibacter sp.]|nr:hypothetical protein [Usitatibacter sp.]
MKCRRIVAAALAVAGLALVPAVHAQPADFDDPYYEFGLYDDALLVVDSDPANVATADCADCDAVYWEFGLYGADEPASWSQAGSPPEDVTLAQGPR